MSNDTPVRNSNQFEPLRCTNGTCLIPTNRYMEISKGESISTGMRANVTGFNEGGEGEGAPLARHPSGSYRERRAAHFPS